MTVIVYWRKIIHTIHKFSLKILNSQPAHQIHYIFIAEPMAPRIMPSFSYQEALQNQNPLNVTIGGEAALLQGSRLTIKCPFTGVPEPKIKWIKDRKMLSSNERMEMDCAGVLNILKVQLEDSGDYACVAESFLGMDMAFSSITVFGKNSTAIMVWSSILFNNVIFLWSIYI